jgi:hypothetical protein
MARAGDQDELGPGIARASAPAWRRGTSRLSPPAITSAGSARRRQHAVQQRRIRAVRSEGREQCVD